MVYGVTGAGKTYTIFGDLGSSGSCEPGLIQHSIDRIFESEGAEISISYLEIYNESVNDLLNENNPLNILEDSEGNLKIPNLKKIDVGNVLEFKKKIKSGNKLRKMGKTRMNEFSSRSHAIVQIHIKRKITTKGISGIDTFVESKLSFVDLAGSERLGESKGKVAVEGGNINRSLLALGKVISKLSNQEQREIFKNRRERSEKIVIRKEKKIGLSSFFKEEMKFELLKNSRKKITRKETSEVFIPYRDSKLTRLLKDSLGGTTKTILITCITPNQEQIEETIHSLNYAARAKKIKNKLKKNEFFENEKNLRKGVIQDNELRLAVVKLEEKNRELEDEKKEIMKKLEEEKNGRLDVINLYLEVIKALEEQYELKTSIEELEKIQEINQQKIDQKKNVLGNLKQAHSISEKKKSMHQKKKLETEIRSLENIIIENDQIMKEMNTRLITMEEKLGNWVKTCPKKFKNFNRETLNKSMIFETDSSQKNDFETSFMDSIVSKNPFESRKDDDLFKKPINSQYNDSEIHSRKNIKKSASKSSLPIRLPVKFPKTKNKKILKEKSRKKVSQLRNMNQRNTRKSQNSIQGRKSLASSNKRSNYTSKISYRESQKSAKNNLSIPIPIKKKRFPNRSQQVKIEKKFIKYQKMQKEGNSRSKNKRFSRVKSSYQSIRTGLGATEENFGVRKIDSLLARFDKENEVRKNRRRFYDKNSKQSIDHYNIRKKACSAAYSSRNLKANRKRIFQKNPREIFREKKISNKIPKNEYNSLLDINNIETNIEDFNQESIALNNTILANDDLDDFKLELVEINSCSKSKNEDKMMLKDLGKKFSRKNFSNLDHTIDNLSCSGTEEKRRNFMKAYRSNQNSSSKTKLFSTAEKLKRRNLINDEIRSIDKYKQSRCSRKKLNLMKKSSRDILRFSKEKTSKKLRKNLFEDTGKVGEAKKMETLAFSHSKASDDDNLSFLTHNIPLGKKTEVKNNTLTLKSEFEFSMRNSEISDVLELEKTQNLIFSSLKKSKISRKLSKARHIKKRMEKISRFLGRNSEMIIDNKYSKIYLKLKIIYQQLHEEFFNLSENEKITFGDVEKFLKEFEKKNGEVKQEVLEDFNFDGEIEI